MITPAQNEQIDEVVLIVTEGLRVAAIFYPPIAPALPVLNAIIRVEATKLKTGLVDGSVIPDGRGGFVPVTNSRYDPKTGEFL